MSRRSLRAAAIDAPVDRRSTRLRFHVSKVTNENSAGDTRFYSHFTLHSINFRPFSLMYSKCGERKRKRAKRGNGEGCKAACRQKSNESEKSDDRFARREQAKRETLETNSWRYLESYERWDAKDRARDLFTTDCSRLDPRFQTVRQRVAYITNVYSNGGQATR